VLSKTELGFLKNPQQFNHGYDRVLLHRIRRKLNDFESRVLPALMQNETTSEWLKRLIINITCPYEAEVAGPSPARPTNLGCWDSLRSSAYFFS